VTAFAAGLALAARDRVEALMAAVYTNDVILPAVTPADQRFETARAIAERRVPRILSQRADLQQQPNLPAFDLRVDRSPLVSPQALGPYIPPAEPSERGVIYQPLQIFGPPMSTGAAIAVGVGAFALGVGAMWLVLR
jgi:hypothetical protein